ncbi:MAG: fibronectin type III domain-containing protein [bacterium]
MSTGVLLLGMILGNLVLAGSARAFLSRKNGEPQRNYTYYIQRPERARGEVARSVTREERKQSWQEFERRQGKGRWQAQSWNTATGMLHRASRVTKPAPYEGLWRKLLGSEDELVDDAIQFVEENPELFQLGASGIRLARMAEMSGIWYLDFQQEYQDIPVYGSRIWFQFDDSYRLISFGADAYPGIKLEARPLIDEAQAWERVSQHLGIDSPGTPGSGYEASLVILPVRFGDDLEYFLAWMVDVSGGIWRYFVDARNGQIISRYNRSRAVVSGTIRARILPQFYDDAPSEVGLRDLYVYLLDKNQVYKALFEDNDTTPAGWKTEGMWAYGQPEPPADSSNLMTTGHGGPLDPDSGYTGLKVFGYNLKGDYTNLMRPAYLTTPDISFTRNPRSKLVLRFWRWLGAYKEYSEDENGNRTSYDRASVEISVNNRITWDTIWSNASGQIEDAFYQKSAGVGWNLQTFDISPFMNDGNQINIRWGIGPTDSSGVFCGWNIDDVEVVESLVNPNTTAKGTFNTAPGNYQTDLNGNFQFPDVWPGKNAFPNKLALTAKLAGKYVEVNNEDSWDAIWVVEGIDDLDFQDPNYTRFVWNPEDQNNGIPPASLDTPSVYSRISSYGELNVYYHINRLLQYIKKLDPKYDGMWRNGKKGPVRAIVGWGDYYTNAFWTPENRIYFGEGDGKLDGYRDFSLFSDIIYHEYTHAITESFYSFFQPHPDAALGTTSTDTTSTQPQLTTELDAMHEAFSDYWAAAMTDDPDIGNGGFWIGHDYVRSLIYDDPNDPYDDPNDYLRYPEDYGDDAYVNSLILSQAMWDVRKKIVEVYGAELGVEKAKETVDNLFHRARISGSTTFADYLQDVITHDNQINQGEYSFFIKELFGKHGISRTPLAPSNPVATVSDRAVHLTWEASPDPDVTGYHVYYRTENDIETTREDPSVQRDAGNVTSFTVDGLTNETTYVLKVKSYNEYGTESESSDYVYATPYDPATRSSTVTGGDNNDVGICFITAIRRR